jgi:hypothetical protein
MTGELVPHPTAGRAVDYEAELDELPVRLAPDPTPCRHERTWLDEPGRRIRCRECDTDLDPIAVLARIAKSRERLVSHAARLRRTVEYLERRVEELTREERNAKARARRRRAG